jgi:hypothetical protein
VQPLKYWYRDSSVGIATSYGLDGPVIESRWGARYFTPVQTGSGAHTSYCTMGTEFVSRGVKQPGCGVDHPNPAITEVKERVELYDYSHSGPSWSLIG